MEDAEWLSSPKVRTKIGRAAQVAGTALALHVYHGGHELEAVAKCGACSEACAHVSRLPWGAQACRRSRESAGADTIRRGKPVPFICHMGFSCVSMSVEISPSEKAVLTLGPFCPSEAPGSLELDARHGLEKLERAPREDLPFSLSDIPTVSAAAVPAVAEWLAEDLNRSCRSSEEEGPAPADSSSLNETLPAAATRVHTVSRPLNDPYQASVIVAALAAGDQDQARAITRRLIEDVQSRRGALIDIQRARTTAIVAAALESAEQAGMDAAPAWKNFSRLQDAVEEAEDPRAMSLAAMKVLGKLKRERAEQDAVHGGHAALNEILDTHLADGITLEDVAVRLGESPSTITKRLQRTFGMSFSEYAGRRRVDRAKALLCGTQLGLKEVARRVGISDASNLGKLFRKHEGISPAEYRKRFAVDENARRSGGSG